MLLLGWAIPVDLLYLVLFSPLENDDWFRRKTRVIYNIISPQMQQNVSYPLLYPCPSMILLLDMFSERGKIFWSFNWHAKPEIGGTDISSFLFFGDFFGVNHFASFFINAFWVEQPYIYSFKLPDYLHTVIVCLSVRMWWCVTRSTVMYNDFIVMV